MTKYTIHTDPTDEPAISVVWQLGQICFDPAPSPSFHERLREKLRPAAVIAWSDETAVGFKLGYETSREEFYSWLGGVHPDYRRHGIASKLLVLQHDWCRERGYQRVTTEAMNDNHAMLVVNLTHGFVVTGTRMDTRGLKVLLARDLSAQTAASSEC